ncbi:MAG: hypothetical protein MRJ68_14865 [Nitrospira sp.]|nr:hypothetical protein [Nitrospira sp.]
MNTELVTQLIILATAIVGLYKAATYRPDGSKGEKSDASSHPLADLFTGLLSFAGVFAFMLIMPAFVWAFTAITSNIGKSPKHVAATPQYSLPYKLSEEPTKLEIMLVAASQIPYENSRGAALEKLTEKALDSCEMRLALAAATAIPYENSRGAVLNKVVKAVDSGRCDKKPNKEMQPTAKSGG